MMHGIPAVPATIGVQECPRARSVHLELDSPWVNQGVGENPIDSPRVNQIQRAHAEAIMVPTAPIVALGAGILCITWMHES